MQPSSTPAAGVSSRSRRRVRRLGAFFATFALIALPATGQITRYQSPSQQAYARGQGVADNEIDGYQGADGAQSGTAVPAGSPLAASAAPPQAAQIRQDPLALDDTTERDDQDRTPVEDARTGRQTPYRYVRTPIGERPRPAPPGEFERYVEKAMGRKLPRFGASLLLPASRDFSPPPLASVPVDYRLVPGDQVSVGLTGSVESQLRLVIDNEGGIFIPRVGRINLAGTRYGDLRALIAEKVRQQYRDFTVSVTIARLHGIRVYVTGYAQNPGAYTVSSLSTLATALFAAGGPASGGSFRSIELRRNGRLVTNFDLYDLLLKGDKSRDPALQNDDVIFIAAVGPQVALAGSVNAEAIYEAKAGERIGDLLVLAGGLSTLADPSRTVASRLSELDARGWVQLSLADARNTAVAGGDILRFLSLADYARAIERRNVLVTIEGEVDNPGHFYLPAGATLRDALQAAGGLTQGAFLFGTEFDRTRVQQEQQRGFDEALRQLEMSITAAPLSANVAANSDPASRESQLTAARAVLDRFREERPDGRVVLDITPATTSLPLDLVLENNDRLYVPPRPTTVGVFGSVYRPGSFQIRPNLRVSDYLDLAGGPQRLADRSDIFVVRANGEVISRHRGGLSARALPGDIVFVPVKVQSNSIWPKIRDVTSILLSFGLTAAAIASIN